MQPIPQSLLPRLASDKFLDSLEFVFTARLKSAGVVKNISMMVCEDEFILNVMVATLPAGIPMISCRRRKNIGIKPLLWDQI